MTLTTVDWALGYARLGWRVFPVLPGDKRPIYRGWQTDATTDERMVRQYFTADPSRNIGLVCGESFDVWDIEAEHLRRVQDFMHGDPSAPWHESRYRFPETPWAITGRGGQHLLTEPTGVGHTRQLHLDGVHIGELKSTGGFIVAAPSTTVGRYRWLWTPWSMELQAAPDWMIGWLEKPKATIRKFSDRLTDAEAVGEVMRGLSRAVENAGVGNRNSYLYWAMRRALENGVPPKTAGKVLRATGLEVGLMVHEVEATIRSAYMAEGVV